MATKIPPPFDAYDGEKPYVFVSYSHKDSDVVFNEIKRLHDLGCRIWYDDGIVATSEWSSVIEKKLRGCSLFLVYITERSRESENVKDEINYAIKVKKPFLYVSLEDDRLPDGMGMRMIRLQGILKFQLDEDTYLKKLLKGIPKDLIEVTDTTTGGPPPELPVRIAKVAGLSLTLEALQGVVPSTTEVPHTFDPLLQVPASAELLQLARQLYDGVSFSRLSPGERSIINSRMLTIIRSMGGALKEVVETIPEADYLMALLFMLDMERISKMGSMLEQVERDAVLYAFPGKIEEYLAKYLTRAPNGRFAEKAKELLNAVAIPEREALIRDIPILAKRTLPSSSYTCTFRLDPDQEGIFVRVETFFQNQLAPNGTQTFRLPGSHTFSASEDSVSIMIASKGLINLGRYDRATASALAHALSRLNALLSEEKADEA